MVYDKKLITKYLNLQIIIAHVGHHNHERINASEKAKLDFDAIVNDTMTFMKHRINSWEKEYGTRIEEVGR